MVVRHYRELVAWQKAMDLVEAVYVLTRRFPAEELYGLTNQVRRASVSIPSNIAEGQGRGTPQEFIRFLRIADGSLQEVETQLLVGQRLRYVDAAEVAPLLDLSAEVGRIIGGLLRSVGA
jgi:four helix bundle protein